MKRSCPICSCPKKTVIYKQNFHNKVISLMEGYDVAVCRDCGFVYADDIPTQEEFNRYYTEMSKYEFNYSDGLVSDTYIEHFQKIYDFIAPYISDKKAKIVDIGCSTGCLLSLFKKNGYNNLLGVDPSSACAKTVTDIYGIEAQAKAISEFDSEEKFDLIILSAVLEHFVDFTEAMEKIRSLLKDGGFLFVEIPDATRFDSHIFTPFQQFSIEHINYFSQFSAANLLSKFSFEIIEAKESENSINQTIDPNLFIMTKKTDGAVAEMKRDDVCEEKLKKYINECQKIDLEVKEIIAKKLADKDKIIVWGVGTHTQRLIGAGLDTGKILYFVDSNSRYHGKKIHGIEVRSPQDIKEEGIPILISTFSYQEEVARQIKDKLKLNNEIIKIYGE